MEVDEADDDVASLLRFFFGIRIFSTGRNAKLDGFDRAGDALIALGAAIFGCGCGCFDAKKNVFFAWKGRKNLCCRASTPPHNLTFPPNTRSDRRS